MTRKGVGAFSPTGQPLGKEGVEIKLHRSSGTRKFNALPCQGHIRRGHGNCALPLSALCTSSILLFLSCFLCHKLALACRLFSSSVSHSRKLSDPSGGGRSSGPLTYSWSVKSTSQVIQDSQLAPEGKPVLRDHDVIAAPGRWCQNCTEW